MRLICGLVRLDDAPADVSVLRAMVKALGAGGFTPAVHIMTDGPAALATLDFAVNAGAGHERPLPGNATGKWLAADLRLDRPRELAAKLGVPASEPPEELAVEAIARWGVDVPDHLHGDFALAAWDHSARQLLCSRDIMGVRPLCYACQPGSWFAFASLPRGLHGSGLVEAEPDLVALGRVLVEMIPRDTASGYRNITWLAAGHSLVLTGDKFQVHRAWNPDPGTVGGWRGNRAHAAETLHGLVQDAVACRLPPTGAVASDLSGGLDSSAVTVIAARLLRQQGRRLHAVSQLARIIPGLDLLDERSYVDAVLSQEPDILWSAVHLPPLASTLEAADVDLPGSVAGMVMSGITCATGALGGAHVLLSGAGGDEAATYNGIGLHAELFRRGYWRRLCQELQCWSQRTGGSVPRVALDRVVRPLMPDWTRSVTQRLRRRPLPYRRVAALSFLAPAIARSVAESLPRPNTGNGREARIRSLTESYVSWRATAWAVLGARHAVSLTYPLKDRRILDFMLSLPLDHFVQDGWTRQPFRNAMADILPEEIRWRDSKFTSFPDQMVMFEKAKPDLLSQAESLRREPAVEAFVDMHAVAAALRAMPVGEAARQFALSVNRDSGSVLNAGKEAMAAVRALHLARHVANLT